MPAAKIFYKFFLDTAQILCYAIYIEYRCIEALCQKGGIYMNIRKELSKGSSSLLVLSVLGAGDMYGYQIIKEIEQRSEFVFSFKEGTLYPILHGFEQEGLVKSYWQDGERGKRRKYYHITDRGLKTLNKSTEDWHSYSTAVENVIRSGFAPSAV